MLKRKRCIKRAHKKQIKCKIYGINAAGIKSKLKSFEKVLNELNPTIWMIQETKLRANETIKCEALSNYQVYHQNRQVSQGGGVALGVNKDLKSTLISEGGDDAEALSVKVFFNELSVRVVAAYGPQESALKEKKEKFWAVIEKEVIDAELEGDGLVIQMDGNLHAGTDIIRYDPNIQNQNGKLFSKFLERNPTLIVVNALDLCEGIITRTRELENKTEKAILDFYIVNEKMRPFITKMSIDEKKEFSLINIAQQKKNKRLIETDHNALILEILLNKRNIKPEREEIYNLRNKVCQEAFRKETDENQELLNCFLSKLPIEKQFKKWKEVFDTIISKCFRKIRITPKKVETKMEKLLTERLKLKNQAKLSVVDDDEKESIDHKIMQIEDDIGEEVMNENYKDIAEQVQEFGVENMNGSGRKKVWDLLKKKFPKFSNAVPVGKKDSKGNLITNHEQLKELYLKTYRQRMRNRPIKENLQDLKELKSELFEVRLDISKQNKSKKWKMVHLETALKALKAGKARDPNGWVYELFMDGVIGENLKRSLLHIVNKIKESNKIPEFARMADISTIYKGKGKKSELVNDRGIFIVPILRSIIMRLIYQDYYSLLDKSMSDSQVGSRKNKNIRNHIWIIHGIITDVKSKKRKKPVDIQIFDYKQCFDGLWLQECLNDFYEGGMCDDKLALLYNFNKNVNIAVKTPVGKTDRTFISDVITQGDIFGPLFCAKQVDTIGKECLEEEKYTYIYREEVPIPPLSMIDDLLCVTECGFKTTSANAFITFKTDSKKLQFGANKCKKMHVGNKRENFKCQELKVDNWEEVEIKNDETGVEDIKDVCNGEITMEEKQEEKYLGDIISTDGKNIKNIKARVARGKGIISRIVTILEGIFVGKFYFEVALMLRNSLLISSMLVNTEAWYNITKAELNLLETIDVQFLRSVLKAPKCTPTEMLYLELGCVPFRHLIIKRRIMFLHYILNENKNSMIYRFLMAQIRKQSKNDWISQVQNDLKKLDMNENLEVLKEMKKSKLKIKLDRLIRNSAFQELISKKETHSKVKNITHKKYEIQNYLKANQTKITQEEAREIFKMRCMVSDVKGNFKWKYENVNCENCEEEEDQEHIISCNMIKDSKKEEMPRYDEILKNNVKNQIQIAKKFIENMKIRKKMINSI